MSAELTELPQNETPPKVAARTATLFVVKLVSLTLLLGFGEALLMQQSREGNEGDWLFALREFVAGAGAFFKNTFDSTLNFFGF